MRAYVTGASGFVGHWLVAHLAEMGDEAVPAGAVDVTDEAAIAAAIAEKEPDVVYHLAGLAHVQLSWEQPAEYLRVNAGGTLNVLEAARRCPSQPRVLVVSSAEVYGSVQPAQLPVTEDLPLRPVSPYAASKAAAELVAVQAHLGRGIDVVRARPFNHAGPGQASTFALPAFARRIVEAESEGTGVLRVGNLSAWRDIVDVRDVVRAYRLLMEAGEPGEVYNVCTGHSVEVSDVVRRMLALARSNLGLEVDPALLRPVDVPELRGDPTKLRLATGWEPQIPLDDTLASVLEEARSRATAAPAAVDGAGAGPEPPVSVAEAAGSSPPEPT